MLTMLKESTHFSNSLTDHLTGGEVRGRSFHAGVVRGCGIRMRGGHAFRWSRHFLEVLGRLRHAVVEQRRLT